MLDKLGQLKDLWKLKGQMEEMKKRLDAMVIKAESPRHLVEITLNGSMEVKEVRVDPLAKNCSEAELGEEIKAVVNKAVRDTQMMAAQAMGSNFGIPNA
ncbi:MAG: YbaB/EbfC family nucleoid-associated protein [Elusimicrobiaceae bacterium]|nr:YbaB/EbfC family nucleoid-associated protein [Elusimicrobiaceae bacterium]MBP5617144.1 YbaB/EbfC family nucleoid-associated protein [Elusimicrobiaceae bacterium]